MTDRTDDLAVTLFGELFMADQLARFPYAGYRAIGACLPKTARQHKCIAKAQIEALAGYRVQALCRIADGDRTG